MTPLEPKPPDPSHPASFFFSWNFPCSSLPMYCQYLSEFYVSFVSSKSSMDAQSGNSRCGSDAVHEPWCFLPSFWVSQLESVTGSATLDVKLVNLGPLLLPQCDPSFCPREGLPSWAMPCFDLCSAAFLPSFPGYGFVPALSHLGKCRFGTFRYAPFPCAPRVCRSILWSDLLCLYQFGAIHALCDLIFFILWRIAVPPPFLCFRL
uniref:Uncharacterized protein n=1 Tax=Opuntia streptacantha TaxID=393608 RepID=A0A7C9D5J4_OPUST